MSHDMITRYPTATHRDSPVRSAELTPQALDYKGEAQASALRVDAMGFIRPTEAFNVQGSVAAAEERLDFVLGIAADTLIAMLEVIKDHDFGDKKPNQPIGNRWIKLRDVRKAVEEGIRDTVWATYGILLTVEDMVIVLDYLTGGFKKQTSEAGLFYEGEPLFDVAGSEASSSKLSGAVVARVLKEGEN